MQRFSRATKLKLMLAGLVGLNLLLLWQAQRYRAQAARLSTDLTSVEQARAEARANAKRDREQLLSAVTRKQSRNDQRLHVVVNSDSSFVALVRGGVRLRIMKAEVGPSRRVGVPPETLMVARPRGTQSVARRVARTDRYELPRWVWVDRALPVPAEPAGTGWLGDNSVVTAQGTLLYARPDSGPLADSSYVMPGALRLAARDLAMIRENLTPGTRIYFY